MKICPFCAESIRDAAIVCRYCQRDLPREPTPSDRSSAQSGPSVVRAQSDVLSGVNIGFGMFCLLPVILIAAVAVFPSTPPPRFDQLA